MAGIRKFFGKARPERAPTEAPVHPEVLNVNGEFGAVIVQWNDHIQAASALKHPIVSRALNKIAESVQQVRFVVVEDELNPVREGLAGTKKKIQAVLDCPNDGQSAAQWRAWMSLNWSAYGRVPMRFSVGAVDSTLVNGVYPLEARWTRAKINKRGAPTGYNYGDLQSTQRFDSHFAWKQKSNKSAGFADQIWRGGLKGFQDKDDRNHVLQSIGLPSEVIRLLLIRAAQTAAGHPNVRYLVTCGRTLTEAQKTALRNHLNQKHGVEGDASGNIPVLNNAADVVIHKLDNDLSDIHSKMPSDDMARLIFGGFGIPIALAGIGAADGAKFAGNYIESRSAFWEDTIIPAHLTPLCSGLTNFMCPEGLVIRPQLDDIEAVKDARVRRMRELRDVNYLTTTEKRALFGLEPNENLPELIASGGARPSPNNGEPNG